MQDYRGEIAISYQGVESQELRARTFGLDSGLLALDLSTVQADSYSSSSFALAAMQRGNEDAVTQEQDHGASDRGENPQRPDGIEVPAAVDSRERQGADHAPQHANDERADRPGRFAARQEKLGQEPGENAQAEPDQDHAGPLLSGG